jgi:[acyl-carrier-protein] S-malonyltransferase
MGNPGVDSGSRSPRMAAMAIAAIFPGQGSHAPGMDEPWRDSHAIRDGLAQLGFDPFGRLEEGTRYQQPALFLCSVAAWEAREGDVPVATAGHSLGEYAALVAAGAVRFEDALHLVDVRARAMAEASDATASGMVALLRAELPDATRLAESCGAYVANDNAPGQVVVAGTREALEEVERRAGEIGARPRPLDVSGAFHTPLMEPAADALRDAIAGVDIADPAFPVISNGTAEPFADVRAELVANLLRPVRWRETLLVLADRYGAETFEELGPGKVLTGLVKRTLQRAAA